MVGGGSDLVKNSLFDPRRKSVETVWSGHFERRNAGFPQDFSLLPVQSVPVAESGLFSGLEIFVQVRVSENGFESGDSTGFPKRGPGQKDPDMRANHFPQQEPKSKWIQQARGICYNSPIHRQIQQAFFRSLKSQEILWSSPGTG